MSRQCDVTPDGGADGFASEPATDSAFFIGKIETVVGSCTLSRSSDSAVQIKPGDPVCEGDTIQTAAGGKVCIRFIDGTVFNLSDSARMVLREFAGDVASPSAQFDVSNGTFAFIAGEMAKTGRLNIDTPFASIRGRSRAGGIGTLSLASLFFAAMEEVHAKTPALSFLDDGVINFKESEDYKDAIRDGKFGTVELTVKAVQPYTTYLNDPGDTIVLRQIGSSVSESHVPNSLVQMLGFANDQQQVLQVAAQGQGPTGFGNGGSGTPPPLPPESAPQPINTFVPQPPPFLPPTGGSGGSTTTALDFVPQELPPPPPPPPPPTVGATIETPNQTGAGNPDQATGTLAFTPVDAGTPTFTWSTGQPLPAAEQTALDGVNGAKLTFSGPNLTDFQFSVPDNLLDFLANNETLTATYNVTLADSAGHNLTQQVVITLTGSNDAPMITLKAGDHDSGAVTEHTNVDASNNLKTSGTVSFGDVDLTDTHSVTVTPNLGALGTLTADVTTDTTGAGGVITWHYTVADDAVAYLAEGDTKQETFTISLFDGTSTVKQDVTVTITGTEDKPTITAAAAIGSVTEDGLPTTASGTIDFADVDLTDSHTVSATPGGSGYLGTFTPIVSTDSTGDGTGQVTWSFAVNNAALQFLADGQKLTQTYTVTVNDGQTGGDATQTVTITIVGTEDVPVITSGTQSGLVTEIADHAAGENTALDTQSGTITYTDADTADVHNATFAPQAAGYLGTFTLDPTSIDTGNGGSIGWNFSVPDGALDFLKAGQTLTQKYDVTVHDGQTGGDATQTVTITITGTEDVPVITSGTQSGLVTENITPHTQSGTITYTDADTADVHNATFAPQAAGYLGTFTLDPTSIDTGNGGSIGWNFSVPDGALDFLKAGQTLTQKYDVTVHDGQTGGDATQTVTITITGTENVPVITSGTQSGLVTEIADHAAGENTAPHTQSGTITYTDADTADVHNATFAPQAAGYLGTFTLDPTSIDTGNGGSIGWNFSVPDGTLDFLKAGQTLTQKYDVTVHDGQTGGDATQTVTITIVGTEDVPVITSGTQSGLVTEIADHAAGENTALDTQSGTITYTDADTADVHNATFAPQAAGYLGTFTLDPTSIDTGNGGSIGWNFSVPDGALDFLKAGQTLTQKYDVTVHDGQTGGDATQTVTITITGTEDVPVITSGTQSGLVTENITPHTQSGTITYTDADTADVHNATFAPQAAGYLGTFTLDPTSIDTGNGGSIGWNFSVPDGALDFLKAGQTLTQKYDVTVHDGQTGGDATQTVTITITGTENVPVITSGTQSGLVTEIADHAAGENTAPHTQSGTITYTDADTADVHNATFAPQAAGYLGTFTLDPTSIDTGNGGSIGWNFSVPDGTLDFLKAGQTLTQKYDVTVHDGQTGGDATQTVTITIVGTEDVPVITSGTQSGLVTEIADHAAGENTALDTQSGTITYTDADTADVHNATFAPQAAGYLGTFTLDPTSIDTGNGGSIGWNFSVPDGALDFLKAGQTLTQKYDVTVHDGQTGGDATQTVTITITGTNDAPVVTASSTAVSEEGLPGGIADTIGNTDTTNSVIANGAITGTDADNDTLTYSLGNPGAVLTSGGAAVTWQGVGTNTLVGKVGAINIITVTIDNSGHYTVTLQGPVDQANPGEDVKSFNVPVNVSDGHVTTPTTLSVNIEDDSPQASLVSTSISPTDSKTNVVLILDLSGSMNDPSGLTGLSRLDVEKAAVNELLEQYDNRGDVMVRLVTFSDSADSHGSVWMTVAAAKTALASLSAGGNTNYDAGLLTAMSAFASGTPGQPGGPLSGPGTQNVSYFLSDGVPTVGSDWPQITGNQTTSGIQANEQAVWEKFLTDNNIISYAFGVGSGVTTSTLNPIAFDPAPGTQLADTPIVVTDLSQLTSTLAFSVPPISGAFVAGINGAVTGGFGADGGHMQSITVDGETYTFNPTANTITPSGGGTPSFTYDGTTHTLTIDTDTSAVGGELAVVMTTGAFTFQPPVGFTSKSVGYVLVDNDGDTAGNTLTFTESGVVDHAPIVRDDHVITNISGSGAAIAIPSSALLYNDTDADGNTISVTAVSGASDGSVSTSGNPIATVTFTDNNSNGGSFVYTGSTISPAAADTGNVTVDRSQSGTTLTGTDFGEILIGRNGSNNTINANGGNDVLIGGTGNDTLNGGAGADMLTGGGGNDTFVFKATTDSQPGTGHFDIITDFTHSSDHIDTTAIAGATIVQGAVVTASTVAANSISWFVDNAHNETIVYVNTTATANHVDMEIHLTGTNINLTGADILHHA